jgi:hypothetical protein
MMIDSNPFGEYLIGLAVELSSHVLAHIPVWVRAEWAEDEAEAAVRRCVEVGVAAFMRRVNSEAPAYSELWELIFPRFFRDEQVAAQVAGLLDGNRPNPKALQYMAGQAGYDPEQFPELDFTAAMAEFEGAFLTQAAREPALQGTIQANQLLRQTQLLEETQAILARIADVLEERSLQEISGLQADHIEVQTLVQGQYVAQTYSLAPAEGVPSAFPDHWQRRYLDALIHQCDRLDLTPLAAGDTAGEPLSIAQVFTTLYLEGATRTEEQTVAEALAPAAGKERPEEMAQEKEQIPITAVEAIAAVPRLVILGRPGGGKSTLVNHAAAQLARRRKGEETKETSALPGWPAGATPLPVRIVLSSFANCLAAEGR